MAPAKLPHHYEAAARLKAQIDAAFAHLDDFHKLSAHMEQSSGMMLGSKMSIETDAAGGRAVGSLVSMSGRMLGMQLALKEVVTERSPPSRKAWRTVDSDLLVIGAYQLGFELRPDGAATGLRVFIDYDLPKSGFARWLGRAFGKTYARWCTERMVADAVRHFGAA